MNPLLNFFLLKFSWTKCVTVINGDNRSVKVSGCDSVTR